ncbi:MAG: hypothetical protein GY792_28970 [Gammaproteobacteria bacterium]|nr:hypothetical protein [Gammaproteobacteria bacterium]
MIAQAQSVLEGWKQFDPALPAIGALTQTGVQAELDQAQPILAQIDALEAQLTSLRNQRDDVLNSLWDSTKRVRSAVKGIYGNDSSEYEMVGGTRLSERK